MVGDPRRRECHSALASLASSSDTGEDTPGDWELLLTSLAVWSRALADSCCHEAAALATPASAGLVGTGRHRVPEAAPPAPAPAAAPPLHTPPGGLPMVAELLPGRSGTPLAALAAEFSMGGATSTVRRNSATVCRAERLSTGERRGDSWAASCAACSTTERGEQPLRRRPSTLLCSASVARRCAAPRSGGRSLPRRNLYDTAPPAGALRDERVSAAPGRYGAARSAVGRSSLGNRAAAAASAAASLPARSSSAAASEAMAASALTKACPGAVPLCVANSEAMLRVFSTAGEPTGPVTSRCPAETRASLIPTLMASVAFRKTCLNGEWSIGTGWECSRSPKFPERAASETPCQADACDIRFRSVSARKAITPVLRLR